MEQLRELTNKNMFWILLSVLLAVAISWSMFGPYYLNPNAYMFAFGGDALTLYYNVAYHTIHGNGHTLANMNYPDGELVFMTDAQGALSTVLQYVNKLIPLKNYVTGIVNGINVYSFLLSVVIYFYIFISTGIKKERAWLFAPFLAIMAPQVVRMIAHHGLGNTTIIPLCILWLIRKYNIQRFEIRDLGMFLVLVFYAFNNPYIGFMVTTFTFMTLLYFMFKNKSFNKYYTSLATMVILPLIILFIYLKIFDPSLDRLKLQWGYFVYKSNLEGIFFAPGSLIGQVINLLMGKGFNVQIEANMSLYLPITITIITALIIYLFNKKKRQWFALPTIINACLISSLALFLYSSAIIFLPLNKNFVEETLGSLLMFKAVARLSWPLWIVLSIIGIIYLNKFLDSLPTHAYKVLMSLIIALFFIESQLYVKPRFKETQHGNFYSEKEMNVLSDTLAKSNIDFGKYQAMLLIPKTMYWCDNFLSEHDFITQFFGMQISLNKKIPLISAMLSRISISHISEKIEFISHPLIEKSLQEKFPNKKKILILMSKEAPLKEGEISIISRSILLFENKVYKLLEFDPFTANDNDELNLAKSETIPDTLKQTQYYREGFEDKASDFTYFGKGALKVKQGFNEITSFSLSNVQDSIYTFSAWMHIDNKKYGVGYWEIVVYNKDGNEVNKQMYEIRRSNDVHNDWIRSDINFKVENNYKIKIILHAERELIVDEIHLKPKNKHSVIEGDGKSRLFDGVRIDLK